MSDGREKELNITRTGETKGQKKRPYHELEPLAFDETTLSEILRSLCYDRHESPFYSDVLQQQADHFQGLCKQHQKAEMEREERNKFWLEVDELGERTNNLKAQNYFLKQQRLFILDREKVGNGKVP